MRIVQLANFWTPTSGGLRVVLDQLATGYHARGHRVLQIVPGARDAQHLSWWGRRTTVASPAVPGAGGYRMILRLRHVERLVEAFGPDAIEVSDRATLAHVAGRWQSRPARVVLIAHERLDHILSSGSYRSAFDNPLARRIADGWNPRCWRVVDDVVAPSRFAADEWHRLGISPRIVPWGVDTERFAPGPAPDDDVLRLAWVGRLAAEKRPDLAVETVRVLHSLDVPAVLTIAGDGPRHRPLLEATRHLPVEFVGHVGDPEQMASILGRSAVSLTTSGIETFGLAVLESMACGTPVVACEGGAAAEVAADGGREVPADPAAMAEAALALWTDDGARVAARRRAESFGWDRTVSMMLDVLGDSADRRVA